MVKEIVENRDAHWSAIRRKVSPPHKWLIHFERQCPLANNGHQCAIENTPNIAIGRFHVNGPSGNSLRWCSFWCALSARPLAPSLSWPPRLLSAVADNYRLNCVLFYKLLLRMHCSEEKVPIFCSAPPVCVFWLVYYSREQKDQSSSMCKFIQYIKTSPSLQWL